MSNIIQSNPNIISLHEDNSAWNFPGNAEIPDYKNGDNPAAQARLEYENDLYIDALHNDQESVKVETGQPLTPIREGGAHMASPERVPAPGEMHGYATNEGRAIDPAHAEAALSAVHDVFAAGEQPPQQEAPSSHEMTLYSSQLAARIGDGLAAVREYADNNWGARS